MSARPPASCRGAAARTALRAGLGPLAAVLCLLAGPLAAQVAVRGETVWTLNGPPIEDGVVVVRDGAIAAVGRADDIALPDDFRLLEAAVVTPGLIDAHSVVGLSGQLNQDHDQDQLESSTAVQPELRAVDAYNPREPLVAWVRSFGVTTVHTGHAPGELVSGQTMVVKTHGETVEDALVKPLASIAVTLGPAARRSGGDPGTRGKMAAMLRQELIRTREYLAARRRAAEDDATDPPARDLRLEALGRALRGEVPLLVTAHRTRDIATALRIAREFELAIWLDGAAEAYLLRDRIAEAGVPVLLHPTMARTSGSLENASFETAGRLADAGIPVALQSGYEAYVPKTRVVLFEAGIAAANGLGFERALASITLDAAEILGVDDRVGSLAVGKDGDLALFDGDPFEYTTHCTAVVIEGEVVRDTPR